eukprot:m.238182 g.238182  ORF g.238182 m.238182 type:complete len:268 (-) comp21634_c0_seq1:167-970(-)
MDAEEYSALSDYDLQRKPHDVVPNKRICIPRKALNEEMVCAICLGLIFDTRASKICLHRFCKQCIDKSLSVLKRECPKCRKKHPTRRSLGEDHRFDNLITHIFPNRDVQDDILREVLPTLRQPLTRPLSTEPEASELVGARKRKTRSAGMDDNPVVTHAALMEAAILLKMAMRQGHHPGLPRLSQGAWRVPKNATGRDLRRCLWILLRTAANVAQQQATDEAHMYAASTLDLFTEDDTRVGLDTTIDQLFPKSSGRQHEVLYYSLTH